MGAAALEELEELTESDNKEKVEDTTEEEITES